MCALMTPQILATTTRATAVMEVTDRNSQTDLLNEVAVVGWKTMQLSYPRLSCSSKTHHRKQWPNSRESSKSTRLANRLWISLIVQARNVLFNLRPKIQTPFLYHHQKSRILKIWRRSPETRLPNRNRRSLSVASHLKAIGPRVRANLPPQVTLWEKTAATPKNSSTKRAPSSHTVSARTTITRPWQHGIWNRAQAQPLLYSPKTCSRRLGVSPWRRNLARQELMRRVETWWQAPPKSGLWSRVSSLSLGSSNRRRGSYSLKAVKPCTRRSALTTWSSLTVEGQDHHFSPIGQTLWFLLS